MYCLYRQIGKHKEILTYGKTIDDCYDNLDASKEDWDGVMLGQKCGDIVVPVEVE